MEYKLFLIISLTALLGETQGSPSPSIQNTCKDNTYTLCKHGVKSACTCREAADNGWCNSDHYTIQNCRLTCGFCRSGSPNSVPAAVNEVPVAVGYHGPCEPNPCGPGNICEDQGGNALCKPDFNEFFGGRNVTSSLPEGTTAETDAPPLGSVTDAPMQAVAVQEYDPDIVPIAGEPNTPIIDAPIRPVTAKPRISLVGQLGPIAYVPEAPETRAPVVAPKPVVMAPMAPVISPAMPAVGFEPVAEGPKAVTAYVAEPVSSAPVVLIALEPSTGAKPIAEMRENMVTDSPIVPIAATPDAIVIPPPIAEHPEGTASPPPAGRNNATGWGFKHGACDGNPCGPNTKCSIAPNGMPRCRCLEDFVPNENTIVGCKPSCMSNEECPGDYYCKASKCARVCGPGACGLKADCDGYQNRAICNCPEGYEGDPYIKCDRVFSNSSGGAAIGKFVVLDINNDIAVEDDSPVRVVYMDTGKEVTEEERADALAILKIAKEEEAAKATGDAEKLVGENNAMNERVSAGLFIISMLLIMQV